MMKSRDNWGWQGRIGMFIVSSEAVPEAEWWAMMPEGCSVHAARVASSTPWATWRADGSDVDLAADLARGAEQFASMQLSAVVLGHSSSGFVGGTGWDAATVQALSEILGPDIAVTTNGLDSFAALKASGIERPFLVLPPPGSMRPRWTRASAIFETTASRCPAICNTIRGRAGAMCRRGTCIGGAWVSRRRSSRCIARSEPPARTRPMAC